MVASLPADYFSEPIHQVDDPSDGADFDAVSVTWVAVTFGQNAECLESSNAMFHSHPKAAEGMVVIAFFFGERPVFCFLVRDFDGGVVLLKSLVATVGIDMGVLWQRRSTTTDFKIMDPAGCGLGNANDAAICRYCNFCFDGVTFLLT